MLGVIGYMMLFKPTMVVIGSYLLLFAGIIGTMQLLFISLVTPTSLSLLEAKLKRATLLLIWFENAQVKPFVTKMESGWLWIKKKPYFLVSSYEDKGYLDGIPTYFAYRGVGKTLNPKAMADITLLEKYGIKFDDLEREIKERGVIPIVDVTDEGELVYVYGEGKGEREGSE